MSENDYLQQVMENQQKVQVDLRAKKRAMAAQHAMPSPMNAMSPQNGAPMQRLDEDTGRFRAAAASTTPAAVASDLNTPAVEVRITGWWRWKTVIVPPNAHVVHTRRGHDKPLHIGLGMSFSYNDAKDSFLVVPGTMQTILINAYCICKELQGLL